MGQWEEGLVLGTGSGPLCPRNEPKPYPTAYKDLQSREETRNAAWRKRGWDENVYYTGEHLLGSHLPRALSEDGIPSVRRSSFT